MNNFIISIHFDFKSMNIIYDSPTAMELRLPPLGLLPLGLLLLLGLLLPLGLFPDVGAKPIGILTISLENKKMGVAEISSEIFPLSGATVLEAPSYRIFVHVLVVDNCRLIPEFSSCVPALLAHMTTATLEPFVNAKPRALESRSG